MIYYLIHQSPIWDDLPDGKRNVRILVVALVLYMIMAYVAREYRENNPICKFLYDFSFALPMADLFVNAINYKLYYGRSILHEINDTDIKQKHEYDEDTHKYYEKKPTIKTLDETDTPGEIYAIYKGENGLEKEKLPKEEGLAAFNEGLAKWGVQLEDGEFKTIKTDKDDTSSGTSNTPPDIIHRDNEQNVEKDDEKSSNSKESVKTSSEVSQSTIKLDTDVLEL